jgi:(p)ppGpp synthase/HD superfamily hydrolase
VLVSFVGVAATVLEYGGDEDLAIAALHHDSVEDQGGKALAARAETVPRVAAPHCFVNINA